MRRSLQLLVMSFLGILQAAAQQGSIPLPVRRNAFVVIAHRGSHLKYPENSLAAFRDAIKIGADFVEVDLRTTSDSVLVIHHDATIDRTTGGSGQLKTMPYAVVKNLVLRNPGKQSKSNSFIPLFEEVLELCRQKINIYIDFKEADAGQTYGLIQRYGMEKQVIIYINTVEQYASWQKIAPEIPVMLSLPKDIHDAKGLKEFLDKTPLSLLDGDYAQYNYEMVATAAARGVQVWPDIQGKNESVFWENAVKMGFGGLQTDHPNLLIRFLKKKHIR